MIGILIVTHGALGESLISCAAHVLGEAPAQVVSMAVGGQDDPNIILPKALSMVKQLNSGDGVLVLSDMYGATPCNIVVKLLQPGVVAGVAGVSLPMLVRAISYRYEPLSVVVEKAISGGREGVVQFTSQQCERYEQGSSD
ncbi:MAG: PTS fructose transporter subunit IIA [Methylotenera sp.]|uniref:PTS sugar transporter subunit IIA n=1 Tax=Methylotenera sp. TaxID=2051956 RepID=UPI002722910C|nr:PTS fructose transporter subunit IIA [Methylotenera sp.]MDO9151085.1 PTS fructose transporter subunit IIA [Methylotenera sp.]